MFLPLLPLLACARPDAPKRWLHFEPWSLPGDAAGGIPDGWCSEDYLTIGGELYQTDGTWVPSVEELPSEPATGEGGSLDCLGDVRYLSLPRSPRTYRSVGGGSWEEILGDGEDRLVASLMVDSDETLWRSIYVANGALPPWIERSDDGGESWERIDWTPVNPAGGEAHLARISHVEGFLEVGVVDSELWGGAARVRHDGSEQILVQRMTVDFATGIPAPLDTRDGVTLSWGSNNPPDEAPEYGLPTLYRGGEAWDAHHDTLEPFLALGPQLFGYGNGGAVLERMSVDPQGHLVIPSPQGLLRSTTPWDEDARDDLLLDPSCRVLERSLGGFDFDEGADVVVVENQGSSDVMTARIGHNQSLEWTEETVLGEAPGSFTPQVLEPGESVEIPAGGDVVVVLDTDYRCLLAADRGQETLVVE